NVLQPWDGGSLRLAMYLATLVCPISMPSLRSSPWIRGAPHRGLAMLISRISLRISGASAGRPPRRRDFHRQYDLKPARCHLITVSGFTIANPRIHGELLKLGFEIAQSSVAKYMVKRCGPPSQGWSTFLRNHAPDIAAMDFSW